MKILSVFLKIIKWFSICLIGIILILTIGIFFSKGVNHKKYKITGENSINESQYIMLGGIEQFIQIRGKSKDNPVILFLHGGPGNPISFYSYYYQEHLLNDYTFVSWEQRGSGRTYYRNKSDNTDLSLERLLLDIDELVQYIKERFGLDKIIIMGHSWGTILGILYMNEYPENISQYIGVSQGVNFNEGRLYSGRKALEIAIGKNNIKDETELKRLLEECAKHIDYNSLNVANHVNLVNLTVKYLKAENANPMKEIWVALTSPDLEFNDLKWLVSAMSNYENVFSLLSPLMDKLFSFNIYDYPIEDNIPITFIAGSSDWITPMEMVNDYYVKQKTENKKLIIMQGMGHSPFLDNQKQFSERVIEILKR